MKTETELGGVRARLKAHKEQNSGDRPVTLKQTGIACTLPKFIDHGRWMKAQRVGKGDVPKAQAAFVAEVVRFEGEKFTVTDLHELVPAGDMLQLIGEIFGDDEGEEDAGEDGAGNGGAAVQ